MPMNAVLVYFELPLPMYISDYRKGLKVNCKRHLTIILLESIRSFTVELLHRHT